MLKWLATAKKQDRTDLESENDAVASNGSASKGSSMSADVGVAPTAATTVPAQAPTTLVATGSSASSVVASGFKSTLALELALQFLREEDQKASRRGTARPPSAGAGLSPGANGANAAGTITTASTAAAGNTSASPISLSGWSPAFAAAVAAGGRRTFEGLLTELSLCRPPYHTLTNADVASLTRLLRSEPLLTSLCLRVGSAGLPVDDSAMVALCDALPALPLLRVLSINEESIYIGRASGPPKVSTAGAKALATALPSLPRLEELSLCHLRVGDAGVAAIAAALPSAPLLTRLNLSRKGMADCAAAALGAAMAAGAVPRLRNLCVGYNAITSAGAAAIARGLAGVPLLTDLAIEDTGLDDDGAAALAAHVHTTPALTFLDARGNRAMGEAGFVALITAERRFPPEPIRVPCAENGYSRGGSQGRRSLLVAVDVRPMSREGALVLAAATAYSPHGLHDAIQDEVDDGMVEGGDNFYGSFPGCDKESMYELFQDLMALSADPDWKASFEELIDDKIAVAEMAKPKRRRKGGAKKQNAKEAAPRAGPVERATLARLAALLAVRGVDTTKALTYKTDELLCIAAWLTEFSWLRRTPLLAFYSHARA